MKSFIHQAYALIHSVQLLVSLRHFALRQFYLRFCHKWNRSQQNKAQPRTIIKLRKKENKYIVKYTSGTGILIWCDADKVFRIIYDIILYTKYTGTYFLLQKSVGRSWISCQNAISVRFPIRRNSNSESAILAQMRSKFTWEWTPSNTFLVLKMDPFVLHITMWHAKYDTKNMKTFPKASFVVGYIFWAGLYIIHQRITRFENLKSTNRAHIEYVSYKCYILYDLQHVTCDMSHLTSL